MPRVATPDHRAQRTFAPLVFRARFQPERLLTPPPLPWNISYPPHGEGKPADDTPLVTDKSPSADKAPLIKIKRPPGEPGRKGERGFSTKDVLDLPEGMYEDLLGDIHVLAAKHLEVTKTISNQPPDKLALIFKEIKGTYPLLEQKFEADWPAKAILQVFLKNTSAKHGSAKSK